jgi:hypothetical protein
MKTINIKGKKKMNNANPTGKRGMNPDVLKE